MAGTCRGAKRAALERAAGSREEAGAVKQIDPRVIDDVKGRLKRVEGQARGLQKMLDEGRDCEEILTQLSAMRSAVASIATILMVENLEACLLDGDDPSAKEALARAKKLFAGFVR